MQTDDFQDSSIAQTNGGVYTNLIRTRQINTLLHYPRVVTAAPKAVARQETKAKHTDQN